nr:trimethylamine methyltransferase family protein [Marinovum sp.]
MRHYQTAFWDSSLNDDQPWETWDEQGAQDYATRANARWKQLLRDYEAPPLDLGTDMALQDFIAREKASKEDMWY